MGGILVDFAGLEQPTLLACMHLSLGILSCHACSVPASLPHYLRQVYPTHREVTNVYSSEVCGSVSVLVDGVHAYHMCLLPLTDTM
jgi:hypothetical protein